MICFSIQIIPKEKPMEYVGAKALVALTWHNKSLSGFSSMRRLQKKIPILVSTSTIYLSLPLLSECLAPGLPSCLSWHRGWHIQRDQLLGHCQLWAVGTGWHSELGYAPETGDTHTSMCTRASTHGYTHSWRYCHLSCTMGHKIIWIQDDKQASLAVSA